MITRPTFRVAILALAFGVGSVRAATCQEIFESVGERALGMGGAFVAVADDASSVNWNPAGLIAGGAAGMTIGWYRFQSGDQHVAPSDAAVRRDSKYTSLGTWPLGVSYGHFTTTQIGLTTDGTLVARSLSTNQYAVSLLQSIVQGLVVGSTFKYLRGGVTSTLVDAPTAEGAFEQAAKTEMQRHGAFDLDVGIMAYMSKVRVGATVKNVRAPSFSDNVETSIGLPREARVGVSVLPTRGLTLAMDLDLDTVDLRGGPRRMFAVGGESHLGSRLIVRAGGRWNLEGVRQPVAAVGLSVNVRRGLWLDGHYSQTHFDDTREYGVAMRAGL